jgi:hypothetical protein
MLGSVITDLRLEEVYTKQVRLSELNWGRNWELLRQRAEAEGLHFDPMELQGGKATHAILWVAMPDLEGSRTRPFNSRFINIVSPWNDPLLVNWKGPVDTWYFDGQGRRVGKDYPEAHSVEMIPLALYGLDHPRIPVLLVDYRHPINPKKRESVRQAVEDLTRGVLRISAAGNPYYMVGRFALDLFLSRTGRDLNQPSRWRAQTQLKLLLALNPTWSPSLRDETVRQVSRASVNPLDDNSGLNIQYAKAEHQALLAKLQSVEFQQKLTRDRQAELRRQVHGHVQRALLTLVSATSLGLYHHQEASGPELEERIASERQFKYHWRILRKAAAQGTDIAVTYDLLNLA